MSARLNHSTAGPGVTRQDLYALLGALGALLTIVTATLFYFGWRRSDVQAQAMSIDVTIFGFSAQDYVLRSISSLYLPLLVIFAGVLCGLWAHRYVGMLISSRYLSTRKRRATVAAWASAGAVGGALVVAGCVLFVWAAGFPSPPTPVRWIADGLERRQWVVPLVLVCATLVSAYLSWFAKQVAPTRSARSVRTWQSVLPTAFVTGLVVLGTFWLLEEYASAVGRGYALQLISTVDRLPRTVVLSPAPLGIDAPGVDEVRMGAADATEVRYRTTGLRLLARSGGNVVLLHEGWNPATGTVIVLSDSPELGWQFSR